MEGIDELRGTVVVNTNLAVGAATPVYPSGLLIVGNLTIGAGGSLTVRGKLTVYGTITNAGTLICLSLECGGALDNTGATALTVYGDCKTGGTLTNTTGAITAGGNLEIGNSGNLSTTTGNVTITGNARVTGGITLSNTGFLTVTGNLRCDNIAISNAGAVLTVEGNCEVLNVGTSVNMTAAGTITVKKDLYCGGTLTSFTGATITVKGAVTVDGTITNPGNFTCLSVYCAGSINNSGATAFNALGDAFAGVFFINTSGSVVVRGDLRTGNDCTTTSGSITVSGNLNSAGVLSTTTGNVTISGNSRVTGGITLSNTGFLLVKGNLRCDNIAISNAGAVLTVEGNLEVLNVGATAINMTAAGQVIVKKALTCAGSVSFDAGGGLSVYGDASVGVTFGTSTTVLASIIGNLTVGGQCNINNGGMTVQGSITAGGGIVMNQSAGTLTVYHDAKAYGSIYNGSGRTIIVYGNAQCGSDLTNGAGTSTFKGDLHIGGNIPLTSGNVTVAGNCWVASAITSTNGGVLTVTGNLRCDNIAISNAASGVTVEGNCEVLNVGTSVNMTAAGTVIVKKDLFCGGTYTNFTAALTVYGDCVIAYNLTASDGAVTVWGTLKAYSYNSSGNGSVTARKGFFIATTVICGAFASSINGDCLVGGNFTTANATVTIRGSLQVKLAVTVGGSGSLIVGGDCRVEGAITLNNTGALTVSGNLRCDSVAISNATAVLTVEGNCEVLNIGATAINMTAAGTITVKENLYCAGTLVNVAGATIAVSGDLETGGSLTNPGIVSCFNLNVGGTLDNTGATGFTVLGDARIRVTFTNTTMTVTIKGDLIVTVNCTTTTGSINVDGKIYVGALATSSSTGQWLARGGMFVGGTFTTNGSVNIYGQLTVGGSGGWQNQGAGSITIRGNCFVSGALVCSSGSTDLITGNLRCDNIAISNLNVVLTVEGNCEVLNVGATAINMTAAAQIIVKENLYCAGTVVNFTAALTVYGNAQVGLDLTSTTGAIIIGGNCLVKGVTTISGAAGSLTVNGDATLIGAVGATNGTATITVNGISRIYGAITATGTVTYKGVYPQVAVNINAINASETNFFILAATTGFHWNVRDLILKAADPGANNILVRLYQLVNGVLTNTHTFTISTAGALVRGTSGGFALYFSLDDMFTRQELADDNMKITVQTSAGGPYAVTGGYKYSSGSMPPS